VHVKFKLSHNMLVRIISQQLASDWRGRPQSQEECLARASGYLTQTIAPDFIRLRQLYDGAGGNDDEDLLEGESAWQKAHLDGVKFRDQASEIVDEFFPNLSSQPREAIIQ